VSSTKVRALGALDLGEAARLHSLGFAPFGERVWSRQEIAELLASPGVRGCLLEGESGTSGFVLWRVAADEAELLTIAVHPDERRRGGGRVLLEAAIDGARGAGAVAMLLEVGEDNPAARRLYDARGFSTVGRRPAYYHRGVNPKADAVIMRLVLDSSITRAG
jgi:ribosomal-protein-alanine N-acetyltransferase